MKGTLPQKRVRVYYSKYIVKQIKLKDLIKLKNNIQSK